MSSEIYFRTVDPSAVVAKLEQLVRADLGALSPVPYRVAGVAAKRSGMEEFLSQAALAIGGGSMPGLLNIEFELPASRPAWLRIAAGHTRDLSYPGALMYLISIDHPLSGEITLQQRKALVVAPKFVGAVEADRLNAVPNLASGADRILESKILVGMGTLELKPFLRLVPADGCSWLYIRTLPMIKTHLRSVTGSTRAGEVLKLAAQIEAALQRS